MSRLFTSFSLLFKPNDVSQLIEFLKASQDEENIINSALTSFRDAPTFDETVKNLS